MTSDMTGQIVCMDSLWEYNHNPRNSVQLLESQNTYVGETVQSVNKIQLMVKCKRHEKVLFHQIKVLLIMHKVTLYSLYS